MKEPHGVIVREAYKDYSPAVDVSRIVDRLLNGVPRKRLVGLKTIVITNSANLTRREREGKTKNRGRNVPMIWGGGFYYEERQGQPAWIELLLDNILRPGPKWVLRVPFLRDLVVSKTLFHELGHHIHKMQAPEHKEREDVAEAWSKKLTRYYFRRHYWYLTPLFLVLWLLLKPIHWVMRKRRKAKQASEATS